MNEQPTQSATILIVDDEPMCREVVSSALTKEGFSCVGVATAMEALLQLRAQKFDLVLLDVEMPGMDGLTCLKAIRADPALCELPVLLLTSHTDRSFIIKARALRANEYVLKAQYRADELLLRIRRHLPRAA